MMLGRRTEQQVYRDRRHAGEVLADLLSQWNGRNPLVLGIPRGGVIVGAVVAERLRGDLDVVVARKIGAPGNPEYAIAAVDPDGNLFLDHEGTSLPREYLTRAAEGERAEIARRLSVWRRKRPEIAPDGRIVIVVDDGIATGLTAMAALNYVRRKSPERIILAVPVAPRDTLARLSSYVDELVCPLSPDIFFAVGQWYEDFAQVTDEEVVAALEKFRE